MPLTVKQLGPRLRRGWHRPSRGTILTQLTSLREGLAAPSAKHLYVPAQLLTPACDPVFVQRGSDQLEAYVNPDSESQVVAVGMAFPQMAMAAELSLRIIAVNIGMQDLAPDSRQSTVRLLTNPTYTPIKSEKWRNRVEYCLSVPGVGVVVKRWNAVMLKWPGQRAFRVAGVDAWIVQHEIDHLDGKLCVHLAREQRRQLYHVPHEQRTVFAKLRARSRARRQWPIYLWSQLEAQVSGEFDLATYERYL